MRRRGSRESEDATKPCTRRPLTSDRRGDADQEALHT